MTATEDRPGLEERYGSAISSAHLEVMLTRCSVDYLIAAGWARDGIGTKLFRLRSEYDSVRGDHQLALTNSREDVAAAHGLQAKAWATDDADIAAERQAEADEAFRAATAAAVTARALVMIHLTTLRETSQELQAFAILMATRQRFMQDNLAVQRIACRALEFWLDPHCALCDGRGFTGGFRAPMMLCVHCEGTGNRGRGKPGFRLAQQESGHQFGRLLLERMDTKTDRVARAMRRFLRDGGAAQQSLRPAIVEALRAKLVDLRSAQAQED